MERDGRLAGYLYIILGGESYESLFQQLRKSYIARWAAMFVAGALLIASILGLGALDRLTRPLQRLRERVAEFSRSDEDPMDLAVVAGEIESLERTFEAMAARLELQLDELRHNDERRRDLFANISHDLRTPVSSVLGYLETLLERRDRLSDTEKEQYLEFALRQCRRLSTLVDQLFELARLEVRDDVATKETFELSELLQDAVCDFRPAAEAKGVSLNVRFPYDLPPVQADIGLIARALDNLIDNAIRHTPESGSVDVELSATDNGVQVCVHDAGPGIPSDELPRLFDRFYRGTQTVTSPPSGAGLGLAIARRIVDLHDSAIEVESSPEQGTTFSFVLSALTKVIPP